MAGKDAKRTPPTQARKRAPVHCRAMNESVNQKGSVMAEISKIEWSLPEHVELVLDDEGVKRWMLSTREGQERVGHEGLVLEMWADHYKAGTKITLEELHEDLRDGQPIGEKLTKADGLSFEDWCKKLDAYHERLRNTESGFVGYGEGALIENTGSDCWLDYFNHGFDPENALDEDRTYWEG